MAPTLRSSMGKRTSIFERAAYIRQNYELHSKMVGPKDEKGYRSQAEVREGTSVMGTRKDRGKAVARYLTRSTGIPFIEWESNRSPRLPRTTSRSPTAGPRSPGC